MCRTPPHRAQSPLSAVPLASHAGAAFRKNGTWTLQGVPSKLPVWRAPKHTKRSRGRLPASRGPTKFRGRLGCTCAKQAPRAGTNATKNSSKACAPSRSAGPCPHTCVELGRHAVQGEHTPGRPKGLCRVLHRGGSPCRTPRGQRPYTNLLLLARTPPPCCRPPARIRPRAPSRPLRARWGWCTNSRGVVHSCPQLPSSCRGAPQLHGCSCLACLLTPQWMQTSPHRSVVHVRGTHSESIRPRPRPSWRGVRP